MKGLFTFLTAFLALMPRASGALEFLDPTGDDDGPGTYTYPTDPAYKKGSFDLAYLKVEEKGGDVEFRVGVNVRIEDPWDSKSWGGNGFSLQMAFIFIDTDRKEGSGFKDGLPGLNVKFKEDARWEKCVILSPQGKSRLSSEVGLKAKAFKDAVVVPKKTYAGGKEIIAFVSKKDLGESAVKSWGFQAAMQSNEGYPDKADLLTRRVNEYNGQHRFGGGSDYECDPHALDILVPPAMGGADEAAAQHEVLKGYTCSEKPEEWKLVELPMVFQP